MYMYILQLICGIEEYDVDKLLLGSLSMWCLYLYLCLYLYNFCIVFVVQILYIV